MLTHSIRKWLVNRIVDRVYKSGRLFSAAWSVSEGLLKVLVLRFARLKDRSSQRVCRVVEDTGSQRGFRD